MTQGVKQVATVCQGCTAENFYYQAFIALSLNIPPPPPAVWAIQLPVGGLPQAPPIMPIVPPVRPRFTLEGLLELGTAPEDMVGVQCATCNVRIRGDAYSMILVACRFFTPIVLLTLRYKLCAAW